MKKEVDFNTYCKHCVHFGKDEWDEPCYYCLQEPGRQNSHKPEYFEDSIEPWNKPDRRFK